MEIELSNGKILYPSPNSNIRNTYTSFDTSKLDRVKTNKTNTFNIPLSPANMATLESLGITSNTSNVPYIFNKIILRHQGRVLIEDGVLHINQMSGGEVEIIILDSVTTLFSKMHNLMLSDTIGLASVILDLKQDAPKLVEGTHKHSDKVIVSTAVYSDSSITSYSRSSFNYEDLYRGLQGPLEDRRVEPLTPVFDFDTNFIRPQIYIKFLVENGLTSLGYTTKFDEVILEDLSELVINSINVGEYEPYDDVGSFIYKNNKIYSLKALVPKIKLSSLIKEVIQRFNLKLVVDEVIKEVSFVHFDKILKDFENAVDVSKMLVTKKESKFSPQGYGIKNYYTVKGDEVLEYKIDEKQGGRLATEFLDMELPPTTENSFRDKLIVNNTSLDLENKFFDSEFERPNYSTSTDNVLNYQRRLDANTRGVVNTFGRLGIGDDLYSLVNLNGESSSVYGNNQIEDEIVLFRVKHTGLPSRARYIFTGEISYWSALEDAPIKRDYMEGALYKLLFSDKDVVRGNDGRQYLGDYAINWNDVFKIYEIDGNPAVVIPKYIKYSVSAGEHPYMFVPRFKLPLGSDDPNRLYMVSDIVSGTSVQNDVLAYININLELEDVQEGEMDSKIASFSEDIFSDDYKFFGTNTGILGSIFIDDTTILTTDNLSWEYFRERYHNDINGLYGSYLEQSWNTVLTPKFVDEFDFNRLVYVDQEQSYFYLNEIKEYDSITGEADLNMVKVYDHRQGTIARVFQEKDSGIIRILFSDRYWDLRDYVYRNSYSDKAVNYIEEGTVLLLDGEEYKFRIIDGKSFIELI